MNRSVLYALAAAALFGASTPFAKLLVGEISPLLLGGLLYLGSGMGLSVARIIRDRGWAQVRTGATGMALAARRGLGRRRAGAGRIDVRPDHHQRIDGIAAVES